MRRLVVLLIWLLPLLVLIILGEEGFGVSPFLVMLILLTLFLAAGAFIGGSGEEEDAQDELGEKKAASNEQIRSLPSGFIALMSSNWSVRARTQESSRTQVAESGHAAFIPWCNYNQIGSCLSKSGFGWRSKLAELCDALLNTLIIHELDIEFCTGRR